MIFSQVLRKWFSFGCEWLEMSEFVQHCVDITKSVAYNKIIIKLCKKTIGE